MQLSKLKHDFSKKNESLNFIPFGYLQASYQLLE